MPLFGLLSPRIARIGLTVYWAVLMGVMHYPIEHHERGRVLPVDKLVHFVAYGILAWLVAVVVDGCSRQRSIFAGPRRWQWALAIVAAVTVHGLVDEVTQPLTGRDFDWWDAAADMIGAAMAVGIYARLSRQGGLLAPRMRATGAMQEPG